MRPKTTRTYPSAMLHNTSKHSNLFFMLVARGQRLFINHSKRFELLLQHPLPWYQNGRNQESISNPERTTVRRCSNKLAAMLAQINTEQAIAKESDETGRIHRTAVYSDKSTIRSLRLSNPVKEQGKKIEKGRDKTMSRKKKFQRTLARDPGSSTAEMN